jgi:hypothetical protein
MQHVWLPEGKPSMLDLARMATSLATSSGVTPGTTPCPASWWRHGPTACDPLTVPRADGFLEPKLVGKKRGKKIPWGISSIKMIYKRMFQSFCSRFFWGFWFANDYSLLGDSWMSFLNWRFGTSFISWVLLGAVEAQFFAGCNPYRASEREWNPPISCEFQVWKMRF